LSHRKGAVQKADASINKAVWRRSLSFASADADVIHSAPKASHRPHIPERNRTRRAIARVQIIPFEVGSRLALPPKTIKTMRF
jgi:hypothetical protein